MRYCCSECSRYVQYLLQVNITKMDGTKAKFFEKICLDCLISYFHEKEEDNE